MKQYVLVSEMCFTGPYTGDIFTLGVPQNATYQGSEKIRGEDCDVWETLFVDSPNNRRIDWVYNVDDDTALPMRVTTEPDGVTSIIDFIDIYVGSQDVGNFVPPPFISCTDESKMPIPLPVFLQNDTVFPMLAKGLSK